MYWINLQTVLLKLNFPSFPWASLGLLGSQALSGAGKLGSAFIVT